MASTSDMGHSECNCIGSRCVYLGDGIVLVRLWFGGRLYVDSLDVGIAQNIMMTGIWEKHVTNIVNKYVLPENVFVDVGSNFGYYSVLAGRKVGNRGKVISIEPNPKLLRFLELSLKANGLLGNNVATIHNLGLSNRTGHMTLYYKDRDYGGGSFNIPDQRISTEDFEKVDVKVETLDNVLSGVEEVNFVKIDAEGEEYNIIRGGKNVINRSKDIKIVLEVTPSYIKKNITMDEYYDYLSSLGFFIYRIPDMEEISRKDFALYKGYVFLHRERI